MKKWLLIVDYGWEGDTQEFDTEEEAAEYVRGEVDLDRAKSARLIEVATYRVLRPSPIASEGKV